MPAALLLLVAAAADVPPMREPPLAEMQKREGVVRVEDAPKLPDLVRRAIFTREGRQPAIVVKSGPAPIA